MTTGVATMTAVQQRSRRRRARGFSLVELMVAMVLSLVLVGSLVTMYVNNSRARDELDRSSRQIENGRYAIDLLADELKLAGFYGELAVSGAAYADPAPCETVKANMGWVASPLSVPLPVKGITGAEATPPCVANRQANTGILALRRVGTTAVASASVTAGNPHLQSSRCSKDPVSTPLVFSDSSVDFTLRDFACAAATTVRPYRSRIYFVASCSNCGKDTIPTLKRMELVGGAMVERALVEGIEDLQFEYGFDTDGDGNPDQYRATVDGVAGSPLNDWRNVVAIRIHLLSRATEAAPDHKDTKTYALGPAGTRGPFNDAFKRRAYTVLVRLNNHAGLRDKT